MKKNAEKQSERNSEKKENIKRVKNNAREKYKHSILLCEITVYDIKELKEASKRVTCNLVYERQ